MTINDSGGSEAYLGQHAFTNKQQVKKPYRQEPVAVIGFANRLPGQSDNPTKLWDLLMRGGVAGNEPPESRWSLKGHFDGSRKPHTVRTPGAMFVENVDAADFDAGFFNISTADAISIDPQQRQLLEVVYEGIENAGLSLEKLHGAEYGCFVGSYAVDYQDIQMRDPEDRADGMTIGVGRAILSNRISHFLNIKGASMTIDTACSGSLVAVDVACRYLQTGQIEGAIIAASNLYLCPEQNQDMGAMRAASSFSGKCHTFDAKADGYCKAEGINTVILKRLSDAIRDGDPIRAVIRGSATNSDGWTPGIASPNAKAQTEAMRAAFSAAGITNLNEVGYLEAHGTGTLAGDPIEVAAASSVFAPSRSAQNPLIVGSIKSNIGHSENAAGISGLIKAIMAVETGIIPGNPTFIDPNPKIDFVGLKVKATRTAIPWPSNQASRIASVNSFGYGGSNAHVVIQDGSSFVGKSNESYASSFTTSTSFLDDDDEQVAPSPQLLVFSANDEESLKKYVKVLQAHLINPSVNIKPEDLAHTLLRRSRLFNRGFLVSKSTTLDYGSMVLGKKNVDAPKIGFVFTGQGAQWSQMGQGVVDIFPQARSVLERLDKTLQSLPNPPSWSLVAELTEARSPDHLRLPEISQPLVTALQLAMLEVFKTWGVHATSVVGHSSGEIAAACAAGLLTPEDAIKIAFFRGQAAKELQETSEPGVGMMAVGLGAEDTTKYIGDHRDTVKVACRNSPSSVTLSGKAEHLNEIKDQLQKDGHFARLLQVNLAYHSKYMSKIGDRYLTLLEENCGASLTGSDDIQMFSSVTGSKMTLDADAPYWKTNMVSPVLFDAACTAMISGKGAANFLIELGPSGALAGPVAQIKKALPGQGGNVQYVAAAKRGPDSVLAMYDVAGRLYIAGHDISIAKVNRPESQHEKAAVTLVDLPNYAWNHSTKYWYESDASKEWRYRPFVHHDLLGSKILNSPWHTPTFRKILDVKDIPWLIDHKMGSEIVFPGAAFCAMAIEAMFQCKQMTKPVEGISSADQYQYRLRNVKFDKALVLEEGQSVKVTLTLTPQAGAKDSWYQFNVASSREEDSSDHCHGFVRIESREAEIGAAADLAPLQNATKAAIWYKALADAGYGFGPAFIKHIETESIAGERKSRSYVNLENPVSKWDPQSVYPMHPASMDGCFQTVTPSAVAGIRSSISGILVPAIIDELIISPANTRPAVGLSCTTSEYVGKGRLEDNKNYMSGCTVYDPATGGQLLKLTGLRYNRLDTDDKSAVQTYTRTSWNPDISFLTPLQCSKLADVENAGLQRILDLVSHKKPTLKVLEANISKDDASSFWLQDERRSNRAAYNKYLLASSDATSLVSAQESYKEAKAATFELLDFATEIEAKEEKFDLLIVKCHTIESGTIAAAAKNAQSLLAPGGHLIMAKAYPHNAHTNGVTNNDTPTDQISAKISEAGFENIASVPDDAVQWAYLARSKEEIETTVEKRLDVVRIRNESDELVGKTKSDLSSLGWDLVEHTYPFDNLQPGSTVIIIDELSKPVLSTVTPNQWDATKEIITGKRSKLLWVTFGSQLSVTSPDNAMVHGFFRTIRAEDPSLSLTTLDVEDPLDPTTISAIDLVLKRVSEPTPKTKVDNEYVVRQGMIHVNRIMVDEAVNALKNNQLNGADLKVQSLHDLDTVARLQAERIGTLEWLHYAETSTEELPVKPGCVEVEIYAAGLNFKDVAVTMGIVPENEHLLGVEGAGVVRRAGKGSPYVPGDRVVVFEKGCFANRVQVTKERCHPLPASMSFEDAATLMGVYLTSMYCLFNLGNLQRGQSVLIHSAAGGVGISSIQLAQYQGAEIYVTVGTEEKRKFLHDNFDIPYEHMFSSRTVEFASEIKKATNGRGVDLILNSLTGDLLDESWRICADGGIMVEIGKKDVLDRSKLSMEPFDRNCSFRALDFSHKTITDVLIAE
ncbi:Compactin diketide synthase mokB [Beauveria bassiana]|uniref:Compactin diketide synthase mokB n=1 Tax=Beauveria bassiana TaxID=176275 RepID=A0A2N6N8F3_BEABA|nr:Compactin diketide synthase mokB [Beauveria bassiana]